MELQLIQSKIYEIRGVRVMLDRDLAEMYGVETRVLNQTVKRNIKRFPDDFMFQLASEEWKFLRSQFVILEMEQGKGKYPKYTPYAFTEQGVAMLSGLLNSDVAIAANISIMRAFVFVRNILASPSVDKTGKLRNEIRELKEYIEEVFSDYNEINEDTRVQLEIINQTLAEMQTNRAMTEKPRRRIGFDAGGEVIQ